MCSWIHCHVQNLVDASQAGEGQLEISINDGEVPNHVQVLGGGKCLVSFTPEVAKVHTIEIKFDGETVPGDTITLLDLIVFWMLMLS